MPFPHRPLPIVLAPMAGPGTPALTAAVSRGGGLGIFAGAYLEPARILAAAAAIRGETAEPFGINLFVESPLAEPDPNAIARAHARLRPFRERLGLAQPETPARPPERYDAQIDALIEARPTVASFTFGIPSPDVLRRLRDAGIATLGTATTEAEARACEAAGIDAVLAQGAEAGGHRGTFLAPVDDSLVGTLALVAQVTRAVAIPVIAAGGIGDGRGIAAALALGAEAAALGSAFLLASEAGTSPAYRRALVAPEAATTTLTTVFSGRTARGVANRMTREIDAADVAPYPYQNAMTRDVREAASAAEDADGLSLWAGQAVALARAEPEDAILARLMDEAREAARAATRRLP